MGTCGENEIIQFNSIQFFIFIMLTQQLQKPITEQHGSKYKTNNNNV
jgi:hypothetical protein